MRLAPLCAMSPDCACLHHAPHRSLREGYAWAEDKEHCEEYGRMLNGDPTKARRPRRARRRVGAL